MSKPIALSTRIALPEDQAAAHDRLLTSFSPILAENGYAVTADSGASITWTRRYCPTWAVVLGILGLLVFLLGLLFFAVKREDTLVASLAESGAQTTITFSGVGPAGLTQLFVALEEGTRAQNDKRAADKRERP